MEKFFAGFVPILVDLANHFFLILSPLKRHNLCRHRFSSNLAESSLSPQTVVNRHYNLFLFSRRFFNPEDSYKAKSWFISYLTRIVLFGFTTQIFGILYLSGVFLIWHWMSEFMKKDRIFNFQSVIWPPIFIYMFP